MSQQSQLNPNRLVFIDEAGAKTNMTRLYGRGPRGQRVYDRTPHGHWCTTTMFSSIRSDGSTACMAVDGASTGEIFQIYIRQVLLPTLQPGDIVMLDNLAAHKNPKALELIQEMGAQVRFLPPYSPDLNPIEKMWSKVKQILRSIKARTEKSLLNAIAYSFALPQKMPKVGSNRAAIVFFNMPYIYLLCSDSPMSRYVDFFLDRKKKNEQ
jgi:transposase